MRLQTITRKFGFAVISLSLLSGCTTSSKLSSEEKIAQLQERELDATITLKFLQSGTIIPTRLHPRLNLSPEDMAPIFGIIESYGLPERTDVALCEINRNVRRLKGKTLSYCALPLKYPKTRGHMKIEWELEGETWLITHLNLYVDDLDAKVPEGSVLFKPKPKIVLKDPS